MPYFKECLTCRLACDQVMTTKGHCYNILQCPKKHEGVPAFPYKFEEMKKEAKGQEVATYAEGEENRE